ncbi:saccharopine dehydrogenase NADP-binding domain-containing protein [Streptomyces rugosispiralis]|uniref:Saccharopine dehydrogenase NADP-binding domain-containing protein n=1 Tax=Streptomyces rugosispiralis TaxID=2967341 RepID=A0ABT1V9B0_9ACTN|nr:saccharopine dehydrogenase NADP-binding domain-containing protein [Streptomyces rugosispiralis]MCQ8193852.1 saccharopine dehydrogenase NADP-binding domain-containing protein [Streptomyces rugosispiralis]
MDSTTTIGVLGGYGAVGSAAVRRLRQAGTGPLLIAGRDPARAAAFARSLSPAGPPVEALAVDLDDPASLDRFAARCRLVVNCAGPSYRVLDTVARAALHRGADYVDAAGDDPAAIRLHARCDRRDWLTAGRTAVLSAGALPGLSGLLPRALAMDTDRPVRLDAYLGGVAALTPAAAGDVLLSHGPEHGVPGAAWREGGVRPRTLEPRRGLSLAAFPQPVNAFPFLSTEAGRLARALNIGEIRWYTVFGGDRLPEELAMAWALGDADPAALVTAAAEDIRRHGSWYGQEFHLWTGTPDGPPAHTLTLRADDSYDLSGLMTAATTRALLTGGIPPGVHFAADVLDPRETTAALSTDPAARIEIN